MHKILTIILVATSVFSAHAQFGKLLKEKAKNLASKENLNKIKGLASDRLSDARAEMDSTAFNFAISVNDNSDLINTDSRKDKAVKLITNFNGQEEATEADRARRLKDAGEFAYAKGYFKRAEALLQSARLIYENNDTDDVNYYTTIANLGLLYSTMGRFAKAEEFTRMALNLRKSAFGEGHSSVGASLNNLAMLQKDMGAYNDSEQNIILSIMILKNAEGENSMPYAIALNNQAMLQQTLGRYEKALEAMDNVITISQNTQGAKSLNHQKFVSNKAILLRDMGEYDKSLAIFEILAKIKERRNGTNHPDYAHVLINKASLYLELDQKDKVAPLLEEALSIYETKFGKEHKLYASALNDLGKFYLSEGMLDKAQDALTSSLQIKSQVLGETHPEYVTNKEDLAILNWKSGEIDKAYTLFTEVLEANMSFISDYFPPMSEAEKTRYWDQLRSSFESFYAFAFDVKQAEIVKEAFDYHITTKGLLLNSTNSIKRSILESSDQELKNRYFQWIDQKELLARYYAYSKEEVAEENINIDSLERVTNDSERWLSKASDAFRDNLTLKRFTLDDVNPKLAEGSKAVELIRIYDKTIDQVKYGIICLDGSNFKFDVIDNGTQLEGRYFKYYTNAVKQKLQDDYSYDQFWSPIAKVVGGSKNIYFSGDGVYNQVNILGLLKNGKYVIDDYDIRYIGNTRNIGNMKNSNNNKTAFLLGNPDFNSTDIDPLPGTDRELNAISSRLKTYGYNYDLFKAASASESQLRAVNNPRVLHVATHGYFIKDDELKGDRIFGVNTENATNNPLLRSGLLLANAGSVDDQTISLSGNDNGILTAYEATNLTLSDTELVVLSACETAVGDVKAGEGVYGLQRAFLSAGAESIMMSLWKVDDDATQQLMESFYDQMLKSGDMHKAYISAAKKLKSQYPHPYYWSAFVLVEN